VDEERINVGGFFRLLRYLARGEEKFYKEEQEELEEMMEKVKIRKHFFSY
jgi:hypothetical protein